MNSYSPTVRRVTTAMTAVALISGVLATATPTNASPATASRPPAATSSPATLQAEARTGALPASHGTRRLCGPNAAGCQATVVTESKDSTTPLVTPQPIGYGAGELRDIYHLPAPSIGQTATIALIETGAYPSLEADLAHYRKQYGLPACTTANGCLTTVNYRGGAPLPPAKSPDDQFFQFSADGETALDLDMASASCPACRILVVQAPLHDIAPSTQAENDQGAADFGTAVQTAVHRKAAAISLSYTFNADASTDSGATAHALYQPGTAIVASTGDTGYNGDTNYYGPKQSGWPENLPWVTAAGGTEVYADHTKNATSYRQTAWEFGGSGCGYDLPPALGQASTIAAHCDGHRAASDLSAIADNVAVYFTYQGDGGWEVFGGTSVSAPFIAGLYARAGHLQKVIGPNTLYTAAKGTFDDVTIGQNVLPNECDSTKLYALCHAGNGWDGPTGLGTPHGLLGL